jgi:hypothetical protein
MLVMGLWLGSRTLEPILSGACAGDGAALGGTVSS